MNSPVRVNLLKWGETLREKPNTILLCIPLFSLSLFIYLLKGDRGGMAASFGHVGVAFKNYYKHNYQKKFLLYLALYCFRKSAKLAVGPGRPTVLLKCAETAELLGYDSDAEMYFVQAASEAKTQNDLAQLAYVQAGFSRFKIVQGLKDEAKVLIEESEKVLRNMVKKFPDSLYLHVWFTQSLIIVGEYFLAVGDKSNALKYGIEALEHSQEYDLRFRIHDAQILLDKIKNVVVK